MDKLKPCPFCERFNKLKSIDEANKSDEYNIEYSAALNHKTFYEKQRIGKVTYGGYALNHCPTCGKALRRADNATC